MSHFVGRLTILFFFFFSSLVSASLPPPLINYRIASRIPHTDWCFVFSLFFSAKTDREEHRKSSVQEAAGDSQVHKMREGLSIGDLASKASKARVRGRAEAELPNLREKVHAQVQIDPPLGFV